LERACCANENGEQEQDSESAQAFFSGLHSPNIHPRIFLKTVHRTPNQSGSTAKSPLRFTWRRSV